MPWRGPEDPGEFPTLGYLVAEWIEDNLVFTDGPKEGQPVQLYDEQYAHLLHRYRLDPAATQDGGNAAFVRSGSMLVRGQKWGKDPLLAMVNIFHAFGPCDFAGWDADGEPVGRPHPSPWVFVAALNDRQTDNTWLPLKAMVENSDLADLPGVDITLERVRLPCGNPMEPLTTTAFGRLGGRFTSGSLTENGLMTDTVSTGSGGGKRSPLGFARTPGPSVNGMGGMWIAATNTWDPTERSHAQRIHESKSKRIYVDARLSRSKVDLADDDALRDELLYLYGDSARENGGHVSVKALVEDCRDTEVHGESEIRRFFLSEILAGDSVLVEPTTWAALARPVGHIDHDPLQPGERITLGFDGSRARDATVLTACRVRDGRLFHLHTWFPGCQCTGATHSRPEQCPNYRVNRAAVDQGVTAAFTAYEVWYLYGDPYKWQDYLDLWLSRYPRRVVEVPTNVESRMDQILERFTTARDAGEVTHDGDAILTDHVRNAVITKGRRKPSKPRVDDQGVIVEHYLKVDRKAPGVLIDASISMLLAYDARGQAIEEGALKAGAPSPVAIPAGGRSDDSDTGYGGASWTDLNTLEF